MATATATKKSTKKATPKKATAKKVSAKKAPAKKAAAQKPSGLRKPQVTILEYLAKQKKARTRKEISDGADVDYAMLNSYIGAHNPDVRKANDAKNFKSLRTLGYVKVDEEDRDGRDTIVHTITAKGRKAIGK